MEYGLNIETLQAYNGWLEGSEERKTPRGEKIKWFNLGRKLIQRDTFDGHSGLRWLTTAKPASACESLSLQRVTCDDPPTLSDTALEIIYMDECTLGKDVVIPRSIKQLSITNGTLISEDEWEEYDLNTIQINKDHSVHGDNLSGGKTGGEVIIADGEAPIKISDLRLCRASRSWANLGPLIEASLETLVLLGIVTDTVDLSGLTGLTHLVVWQGDFRSMILPSNSEGLLRLVDIVENDSKCIYTMKDDTSYCAPEALNVDIHSMRPCQKWLKEGLKYFQLFYGHCGGGPYPKSLDYPPIDHIQSLIKYHSCDLPAYLRPSVTREDIEQRHWEDGSNHNRFAGDTITHAEHLPGVLCEESILEDTFDRPRVYRKWINDLNPVLYQLTDHDSS